MEYTKGEWKARKLIPDKHGIITKEAWEITTPEYDVAAQIIGSAPIRREADAHLISAAPDMYKVLKIIVDEAPWKIDPEWQALARKALAKAEGK